ncbi:hypothetical protein BC936DRAFT_144884 [Jimgerdemannia flammicorona]|nr:hypothetical protein BC936DRAFT_144884 [Jimgerdemannia flammicorona]
MSHPALLAIPRELTISIAAYFPLRDLVRLANVNRELRSLVYDAFDFWSDLTLTEGMSVEQREALSDDMLENFISVFTLQARSGIHHVDISESGPQVTTRSVDFILTHCPNLRTFSLKSCASINPDNLAHTLTLLLFKNPPLRLPHLSNLYLRNELRQEDRILQADFTTITTIEYCLRTFSCLEPSSSTNAPATPTQTATQTATKSPSLKLTDLHTCELCRNYYAAPTPPCSRCGALNHSHLCFVCQSFCDGCFAQFCHRCVSHECRAVMCQCTLKDMDVMCYCRSCRGGHQCAGCGHLWCPKHIVETCTKCHVAGWCQTCAVQRGGALVCAGCVDSKEKMRSEGDGKWWQKLLRLEREGGKGL